MFERNKFFVCLSDEELAEVIRSYGTWDTCGELEELIWRVGLMDEWVVEMEDFERLIYEAAELLGVNVDN